MFLVDISPSMGKVRTIGLPGEDRSVEMTNLEWALQFVKLKIQEMVRI
jgi:ATP-dependent DNA helicase 2 subunit 2